MITEVTLLYVLLFLGFILAPMATNKFFLNESKIYSDFHKISLMTLAIGAAFNLSFVAYIWPVFCIFGLCLFLKNELKSVSIVNLAVRVIPFIFSIISSLWFVAAINDFHLLGYGQAWSLYAALHGCFLGWVFVGNLAYLSARENIGRVFLPSCYMCFVLFLMVAFGIDGLPYVKRIGVIGFSILVPVLIAWFAFSVKKKNLLSYYFSRISLFLILISMILALLNEFWADFPKILMDLPTMVLSHGLLNAALVLPLFTLAVMYENANANSKTNSNLHVIFFDDICVLCSGTVAALIRVDVNKNLKYSSLQGEYARKTLQPALEKIGDSIAFWSNGVVYERASAVIHILFVLGGVYRLAGFLLKLFPLSLLNMAYEFVARNRYRIFGKNESCLVPPIDSKELFIR